MDELVPLIQVVTRRDFYSESAARSLRHLRRHNDVVLLVRFGHDVKEVEHSDHKLPGRVLSLVKLHVELDVFCLAPA